MKWFILVVVALLSVGSDMAQAESGCSADATSLQYEVQTRYETRYVPGEMICPDNTTSCIRAAGSYEFVPIEVRVPLKSSTTCLNINDDELFDGALDALNDA